MQKAVRIALVAYIKSSSFEHQGNRQSIQRYLNEGYRVKESRNGYWVLYKNAQALVTVDCGNNVTYTMDMSYGIKMHYGAVRISESLVRHFIDDCNSGRVEVYTDGSHYEIR